MYKTQLDDTSEEAARVQFDLIRQMTPAERGERMSALTLAVQQLAFAGMKERFPDADDDEIWLRLAADRLGRDIVKKIYGFDAEKGLTPVEGRGTSPDSTGVVQSRFPGS